MKIIFVFDNTGTQDIEKKHVIKMSFDRLTKCLCSKFRKLQSTDVYECASCDMIIASAANKLTTPDFPILSDLSETTVFDNITHNTLQMIEVVDGLQNKIIYVPSKVESCKNIWQKHHIDEDNNLHIQCKEHGCN